MSSPAFAFTGKNEAAQTAAAKHAAKLIVGISDAIEAAIRALVIRSISEGIPVYDAARLIESMIGLDERRMGALMGYRETLINEGLSFDRVNTLTDRYSAKLLKDRAKTIARTEVMGALNEGARESWREAQRDGLLSKDAVKEWLTAPMEGRCDDCAPMDGVQVPLRAKFNTSLGLVDGPPIHPNCKCVASASEPDR